MKTKYWVALFVGTGAVCLLLSGLLLRSEPARAVEIRSDGKLIATLPLSVDREIDVGGHNTVTIRDGKVAVTQADCPDHYCMQRGFCDGGRDIVCLPNRLVIHFLGPQEIDAAIG